MSQKGDRGHTILSDGRDSLELWTQPGEATARLEAETPNGYTVTHMTVDDLRELSRAALAAAAQIGLDRAVREASEGHGML